MLSSNQQRQPQLTELSSVSSSCSPPTQWTSDEALCVAVDTWSESWMQDDRKYVQTEQKMIIPGNVEQYILERELYDCDENMDKSLICMSTDIIYHIMGFSGCLPLRGVSKQFYDLANNSKMMAVDVWWHGNYPLDLPKSQCNLELRHDTDFTFFKYHNSLLYQHFNSLSIHVGSFEIIVDCDIFKGVKDYFSIQDGNSLKCVKGLLGCKFVSIIDCNLVCLDGLERSHAVHIDSAVHRLNTLRNAHTVSLNACFNLDRYALRDLENCDTVCLENLDITHVDALANVRNLFLIDCEYIHDISMLGGVKNLHLFGCHSITELPRFNGMLRLSISSMPDMKIPYHAVDATVTLREIYLTSTPIGLSRLPQTTKIIFFHRFTLRIARVGYILMNRLNFRNWSLRDMCPETLKKLFQHHHSEFI